MAHKVRPEKVQVVDEIKDKVSKAKSVILTDYMGLNVEEITALRRELRANNVEYKVYKNTMAYRALEALEIKGLDKSLKGPTAFALSYDDPVAPAKVLVKFAKQNSKFSVKAGMVEGKVVDQERINALSELPSRDELLAMLLRTMQGPVTGFVNVLAGNIRNLVGVLSAIQDKKSE